jgi:hypothetical protein
MKKVFIAAIATVLLTSAAFAHNSGGNSGSGNTSTSNSGRHDEGQGLETGNLTVASDGTVFINRDIVDTTANTVSTQIEAVRSTGTVAWTVTIAGDHDHLLLSGSNLIFASESTAADGTISTTLTALSTTSGAQAWTRTLSGRVTSLTPFNGGTYAVVVVPAATSGAAATRSLVAIGNDGSVLFTLSLS